MHEISAIALFCDDIREEKSGAHSIIGIMGDNIIVPGFPGAVPKLGIYIRLHLSVEFKPCKFAVSLIYPNGDRLQVNEIEQALVRKTLKDAKLTKTNIAGIYSQLVAAPFPVSQEGRIAVEISWNQSSMMIGGLNFVSEKNAAKKLKGLNPRPNA